MCQEDADSRGITEGDAVRIFNQFGEVQVKAAISNIVPPGYVDFMYGWEQANTCNLVDHAFDPISGFPTYQDVLCEIEKI